MTETTDLSPNNSEHANIPVKCKGHVSGCMVRQHKFARNYDKIKGTVEHIHESLEDLRRQSRTTMLSVVIGTAASLAVSAYTAVSISTTSSINVNTPNNNSINARVTAVEPAPVRNVPGIIEPGDNDGKDQFSNLDGGKRQTRNYP